MHAAYVITFTVSSIFGDVPLVEQIIFYFNAVVFMLHMIIFPASLYLARKSTLGKWHLTMQCVITAIELNIELEEGPTALLRRIDGPMVRTNVYMTEFIQSLCSKFALQRDPQDI